MTPRGRIGVIGGGVAGLTAAWLLQRRHDVVLFERNDYIGGHTHTIKIPDGPDAGTPVDTGFIVMNNRNYPLLQQILDQLNVARRWSDMSFGYYDARSGFCYAGTDLGGMFAQRKNLLSPAFYRFLFGIRNFARQALEDLQRGGMTGLTLGDYLERTGTPAPVIDRFILPMTAAIWSASRMESMAYPAESLMHFWRNHGLLAFEDRPRWQTIVGGSHAYVKAMLQTLGPNVHARSPATAVRRTAAGAEIRLRDGRTERVDRVVIATHADEALKLLEDPTSDEQRLLAPWHYAPNRTVLHTDVRLLSPHRRAWASWNYVDYPDTPADAPVTVSYWMNLLQGLTTREQYFVTLNPRQEIDPHRVVGEFEYHHPQFTASALAAQRELPSLNGRQNTFFCGSYFGHGFHEDAARSGVAVAKALGVELA